MTPFAPRVDNKTPKCMFGSYLGKQNELRKQLTSAGSTATGSSGVSAGWDIRDFTLPPDATIEQKIEHFLIIVNYKRIPSSPRKRFPYLRRTHKVEPSQPPVVDVMELHASAFTSSYPRILRHVPTVESKLRNMPLFYQKASISSEESSVPANTPEQTETHDEEHSKNTASTASSTSAESRDSSSRQSSASENASSASSAAGQAGGESDPGSYLDSEEGNGSPHLSAGSSSAGSKSRSGSSISSSTSTSSKSRDHRRATLTAKLSTASTISTLSSSPKIEKPQRSHSSSVSTLSTENPPGPSKSSSDERSVMLRIPDEERFSAASPSVRLPKAATVSDMPEPSAQSPQLAVDEISNADTTHDVSPMESENNVSHEEFDTYVDFLNDVTDVVLGMGVYSPSAIQAAIDAALATNVYGDVDRERAQTLVEQLFS
ncbi:protein Wnt-4-like [Tropilaelaps mercedesae]|uniref:Protein Wnt-4-like n=1 Tax=Tropilaelaps mercedesae TaxID=418985 RepID=A0A1V9XYT1_9ACAR|nr:protein Wnt-4-like [Tropilaelaps mercedesae]